MWEGGDGGGEKKSERVREVERCNLCGFIEY